MTGLAQRLHNGPKKPPPRQPGPCVAPLSALLTVPEALERIADSVSVLPHEQTGLAESLGRTLAIDVQSDIDSPPHDKAMMDGYAVVAGDPSPARTVLEEVTAGEVPSLAVTVGAATRIMTGAPLPRGADAVVPVEEAEEVGPQTVRLPTPGPPAGKHVMPRGDCFRRGEVLIKAGVRLTPAHVALLAESGNAQLHVHQTPRVGFLATGDELVDAAQIPAAGQIRNSNGPMLQSLIRRAGADACDLGTARDSVESLREHLTTAADLHVLLLSGGVSAGVKDLAPQVFDELGVKRIFHKVAVRPGKPLWFGVWPHQSGATTLVFGLPGNPVSGFVCFQVFVLPVLSALSGRAFQGLTEVTAELQTPLAANGDRQAYLPAIASPTGSGWSVAPTAWRGSADLAGLSQANALVRVAPGANPLAKGERVVTLLFQSF